MLRLRRDGRVDPHPLRRTPSPSEARTACVTWERTEQVRAPRAADRGRGPSRPDPSSRG